MKGDTVTVTVRTPVGVEKTEVMASIDGSSIDIIEPRSNETYLRVEEQNRNRKTMTKYLFAKSEVLSVVTGHKSVGRKRRVK